jgi:hypothetical protein
MTVPHVSSSGSLCEQYGHNWRSTKQAGTFRCSNCKKIGYCRFCLLTPPASVFLMECQQHTPLAVSKEGNEHGQA